MGAGSLGSGIDSPKPSGDTQTMASLEEQIRAILIQFPAIECAILFGSCASGRQTPQSDLDLAYVSKHALSAIEKMALTDALALRIRRPIDLVDLNRVAAPLLREILARGQPIDPIPIDITTSLFTRLLDYEADFMPSYRQAQRERLEAFANG